MVASRPMFACSTSSEYGTVIAARGRVAMDGLAEVAVGVLHREVTEVQRVLRTAAELRNGAVELDVEVVDGHDQVIQERRA